jgi:hypothetical protein
MLKQLPADTATSCPDAAQSGIPTLLCMPLRSCNKTVMQRN